MSPKIKLTLYRSYAVSSTALIASRQTRKKFSSLAVSHFYDKWPVIRYWRCSKKSFWIDL